MPLIKSTTYKPPTKIEEEQGRREDDALVYDPLKKSKEQQEQEDFELAFSKQQQEQEDFELALALDGMNQSERGYFSATSNQSNLYPNFFSSPVSQRVPNPVVQKEKPLSQTIQNPNHAISQKEQEEEDHKVATALDAYYRHRR